MTQSAQTIPDKFEVSQLLAQASGFIFDMDDLLVRSKAIWHEALSMLLLNVDQNIREAEHIRYRGLSAADTARRFHETLQLKQDLPSFQEAFAQQLLRQVHRCQAIPLPGAVQAIRQASCIGCVAVASGSPQAVIESILSQLGVIDAVDVVLSSDQVRAGKPEPDVFLEASRLMDQKPRRCVVFEDSVAGVMAASSAGISCIAVPSEKPAAIRILTPYVFDRLSDLPWAN